MAFASARACVVAGLLVTVGACTACTSLPKMDPRAPVEKESIFLGTQYRQFGKVIDRGDMMENLHAEPRAAEELSGHGALSVSSFGLGLVGGAMVGWPVGEALAGKEDPLWILAAIGGGLIAVSIPLAIVAENKLENAVDAHNQDVGAAGAALQSVTAARASEGTCSAAPASTPSWRAVLPQPPPHIAKRLLHVRR